MGKKEVRGDKPVSGMSRRDFMKCSAGTVACLYLGALNTGCGSSAADDFPVVVFSDVHFNPLYDGTLFQALIAADASQWDGVFKTSGITSPSAWGKDSNYPLLELALESIKADLGASPFVIFTGDILGHGLPQIFYYHLNGTTTPRDAADTAAMQAFTDKAVAFFMDKVRKAVGKLPVFFALGNGDSYTGYGPDSTFLSNTAELYYTALLNGMGEHQEFLKTFTSGGYYSVEPPGTNLVVIGMNTIIFSPLVAPVPGANDAAVAAQLDWLDSRLAAATVAGKKVWLLMHAPPGADLGTTAQPAHVDANGHISSATMMWVAGYQTRFLKILDNYPAVVSLTLAGHTHMDEYRILPSSGTVEITPAIAPYFGNNPAFKVFTISGRTLKPVDYSSFNYVLAAVPLSFSRYYTFSAAYSLTGNLDASLARLTPALVTNTADQALYRGYYYSGHNTPVSVSDTFVNTITGTNWPIYWSGIGNMDEDELVASVNAY
ncbi:metallophosphoesterase [Geomonas sp. Red69]|uniref:metallophosphoesterase n=1 Tax=Geomonas diazotrophica TaxID=2843197 RepID=UPI001C0F5DE9|nr:MULTISPECIES: metallophosphoesterase [Geomonas]MBU5635300.1 metallophosphoesterase [Geomonas diazotrophica]QXE86783.1 metallophosphoesterase [Geomonas nitrogeniifigens]